MSRPYRPESASSSVVHAPKRGSFCVLTWGGLREGRFPFLFQICALVSPCSRCISTTNFRPPKGLIVVFVAPVRGRGLPNTNRVVIRRPHSTPFFSNCDLLTLRGPGVILNSEARGSCVDRPCARPNPWSSRTPNCTAKSQGLRSSRKERPRAAVWSLIATVTTNYFATTKFPSKLHYATKQKQKLIAGRRAFRSVAMPYWKDAVLSWGPGPDTFVHLGEPSQAKRSFCKKAAQTRRTKERRRVSSFRSHRAGTRGYRHRKAMTTEASSHTHAPSPRTDRFT